MVSLVALLFLLRMELSGMSSALKTKHLALSSTLKLAAYGSPVVNALSPK